MPGPAKSVAQRLFSTIGRRYAHPMNDPHRLLVLGVSVRYDPDWPRLQPITKSTTSPAMTQQSYDRLAEGRKQHLQARIFPAHAIHVY